MRVFLASSRPAEPVAGLVGLIRPGARVAVVANAQDRAGRRARRRAVGDELGFLLDGGLSPFELDLRRFYRRPERLCAAMAEAEVLWVAGGNAFVLREAMGRSGLDAVLRDRLAGASLVYVGFSAGACVCGSTLRGLELVDKPPRRVKPLWDGLKLTDFAIVPHYRSGTPVSAEMERVVEYLETAGTAYRVLRDGESIVIDAQSPVSGHRGGALR
ncbi:MAG: Type 1 glutamine amidotransferase-like domain-containing protein [Solirubrobacteraceae bacterium]